MNITKYHFPIKYKIAILADVHNERFDTSILKKESVDLILIPGDICSMHLSKEAFEKDNEEEQSDIWHEPTTALHLFSELPNIAPTYFSIGNHESIWNDIDKKVVRESGTILLDNDFVKVNDLLIGGISSTTRHGKIKNENYTIGNKLIEKMKKEEGQKIILLHEPHLYYAYQLNAANIDLIVSGHAHGGQWRFFNQGIFAPGQGLFPKYTKGLYDRKLLVSAGMSNTAFPIPRLFNPTEIVIIE